MSRASLFVLVLLVLAGSTATASNVDIISFSDIVEPSTSGPSDKDGYPPVSSSADPEEAILAARLVVTAPLSTPTATLFESDADAVDDLTIDDDNPRDLDPLDGVIDATLAPGTYTLYWAIEKSGYKTNLPSSSAGFSETGDVEDFWIDLSHSGGTITSPTWTITAEGSASINQNDLDFLEAALPPSTPPQGTVFQMRAKYSQSSSGGMSFLTTQLYYEGMILRVLESNLHYYDSDGVDPGSVATGVPPGWAQLFANQPSLGPADLPATLSSGDHWVLENTIEVWGAGTSWLHPYIQTRASATANWKLDSGYGGFFADPEFYGLPPEDCAQDDTPPAIECPDDVTVVAGTGCCAPWNASATATDACDPTPTIAADPELPATLCGPGPHVITYTATDDAGNSASCTTTVTVADATPPAISCPPSQTVVAGPSCCVTWDTNATATDACDPTVTVISNPPLPAQLCGPGPHVITYTATDDAGNSASCTTTVTLVDQTPPVISCPPSQTINAGASCCTTWDTNATATDDCDPTVTVISNPPLPAQLCGPGPHVITYTATDDAGNSASCTTTVTVADATPPAISCPPSQTVVAGPSCCVTWDTNATATDACDPTVTVISNPPLPATLCGPGPHVITYTATDDAGNSASCTTTVTLVDQTPPVISCPPSQTINAGASCCVTWDTNATATDACDPTVTVISNPPLPTTLCGPGPHVITYTATDDAGNSASCTTTVTVVDATPPAISCPPSQTVVAGPSCCVTWDTNATATDACDPTVTVISNPPLPAQLCGPGPHVITYTATDDAGNSASCTTTVTVVDATPPAISCPPSQTVVAGPSCCVTWDTNATATDACDPTVTVISNPPLPATLCGPGPHVITYTATDDAGNSASCTTTVTLVDQTPPVISCPPSQTINAGASCCVTWDTNATATDACDPTVTVISNPPLPTTLCGPGTHVVTYTATDDAGNSASCTTTITIADTTPPALAISAAVTCLWPPNHKFVDVGLSMNAVDDCTAPQDLDVRVSRVLSDEQTAEQRGAGGPQHCPDAIVDGGRLLLRAERSGNEDGRVYTVFVAATDSSGNTAETSLQVRVPHDQNPKTPGQSPGNDPDGPCPAIDTGRDVDAMVCPPRRSR